MTSDDRAQIETIKKRLRRKYADTPVTSGQLTANSYYLIACYNNPDDFTNVGANQNGTGETFQATGQDPAQWSGNSKLIPLNIAQLKTDANAAGDSALDPVTVRSIGFEGGTGSGDITTHPALISRAYEELIEEWDPDFIAPDADEGGFVIQLG